MIVLILHYEPDLWEDAKYNPVSIQLHKCTFKRQSGLNLGQVREQAIVVSCQMSNIFFPDIS